MLPRLPLPRIDGLTDAFREWRKAILWSGNPKGGELVRCQQTPNGPLWKLDDAHEPTVMLSGSANPYSGTVVYESPSGTWAAYPGSPSYSNIFEANGVTGLSGKVVRIRPGFGPAAGEWRFRYIRKGSGVCLVDVFVTGPCGAVSGASVSVTGPGSFSGACTTDVAGHCTVTVPSSGTYSVSATRTGYVGAFGNVTVTCPGTTHVTRTLTLTSGYSCSSPICCDEPGPPYADFSAWPTSFYLSDGFGTITLTGGGATPGWRGSAMRSVTSGGPPFDCTCLTGNPINPCGCAAGTSQVPIYFEVDCTGSAWQIGIGFYACSFDPVACSLVARACTGIVLCVNPDTNCGDTSGFNDGDEGPTAIGSSVRSWGSFMAIGGIPTPLCASPAVALSGTMTLLQTSGGSTFDQIAAQFIRIYGDTPCFGAGSHCAVINFTGTF